MHPLVSRAATETERIATPKPVTSSIDSRHGVESTLDTRGLLDGDGLGEVPRTVDVAAASHGEVVAQQLHRDDRQDSLRK